MKTLTPGAKRTLTMIEKAKSAPWPPNSPNETWLEIPGFEFYLASSSGKIWSLMSGKVLAVQKVGRQTKGGDRYLGLRLCRGDGQHHVTVHSLVCQAFHGPRPNGHEVAHKNGVRSDNRSENLCWKTPKENAFDKKCHGSYLFGVTHQNAKLTDDQVREIRNTSGPQKEIARKLGVSQSLISLIRLGKGWEHIK